MILSKTNKELLIQGQPPADIDFLKDMTVGREIWIEPFIKNYLSKFIPAGGSKVKFLIGQTGTGKTHMLKLLEYEAEKAGYDAVFIEAKKSEFKINDMVSFYKVITSNIDFDRVIVGLCKKVGAILGYGEESYDGKSPILPRLVEDEGMMQQTAIREIRIAVSKAIKHSDFSASFLSCIFTLLKDSLTVNMIDINHPAIKWLKGEKLETHEKRATTLFETLRKSNARQWLNSLLKLLIFSGVKGLVVLIDDLDVLYKRQLETNKYFYTSANVKDVYELIRQLIDDTELLSGFLLVLAGNSGLINDENRGFKSYEALWMRLQSGLVPSSKFNALCDIVDMDRHTDQITGPLNQHLRENLFSTLKRYGIERKFRDEQNQIETQNESLLRSIVSEAAFMSEYILEGE